MRTTFISFLFFLCAAVTASAGWFDTAAQVVSAVTSNTAPAVPPPTTATAPTGAGRVLPSQSDAGAALKEALGRGVDRAVSQLGRDGGFLTNLAVRIPMPDELQRIETALRLAKQDKLADAFVTTMNHAAEKAAVEAVPVFAGAVQAMTWQDALGILRGPTNAATLYLRRTSGGELEKHFLPVVQQATAAAGVTAAYKALRGAAPRGVTSFFGADTFDVDAYVTRKTMDGLFQVVAAEEQRIRADPVARTTDLLQRVFGTGR